MNYCTAIAPGKCSPDYKRGQNPGKCATTLVVEDNEDNRGIYGTMLRARGFIVQEAVRAEPAIASVRMAPPDLVLMDIGLPTMDASRPRVFSKATRPPPPSPFSP